MVKKLLKHELVSYMRILLPIDAILLIIAAVARIIQFFESDTVTYCIIFGSSIFALVVGIMACMFMAIVVAVIRFYKNFFTAEGYLTFTLPITPAQHITVKLLGAMIFQLIAIFTVFLALVIVSAGDVLVEVIKAAVYLISQFFTALPAEIVVHCIFYGIEMLIMIAVSAIFAVLVYYTCISIGQMARKNRVFMAVLAYFGYYLITQVLSTILMVVFTILELAGALDWVSTFFINHTFASIHIIFCTGIVVWAGLSTLLFFINRRIITKKLNLE